MRTSIIAIALAATLSLTACEGWKINGVDTGVNSGNAVDNSVDYCKKNKKTCIIGGVLFGAGLLLLVSSHRHGSHGGQQQP